MRRMLFGFTVGLLLGTLFLAVPGAQNYVWGAINGIPFAPQVLWGGVGVFGPWTRTGTVLTPTTSGDTVSISGGTTTAITDLLINPATKSSGILLDLQVGGASKFRVDLNGTISAVSTTLNTLGLGQLSASGTLLLPWSRSGASYYHALEVLSGATSTTYNDPFTTASTTVGTRSILAVAVPTITAANASVTYTNASTIYIGGAPSASTNVTITNPYALFVDAGNVRFDGVVYSGTTAGCSGTPTAALNGIVTTCTEPIPDPLTVSEISELRGMLSANRTK